MNISIDFNVNLSGQLLTSAVEKLSLIIALLQSNDGKLTAMTAALDKLTLEVAETKEVMASAVVMIAGLADQIRALKDDPAALEALAGELDGAQAALAAAISANTPAEPAPVDPEPLPPVEEPAPVDPEPAPPVEEPAPVDPEPAPPVEEPAPVEPQPDEAPFVTPAPDAEEA